MLVRPLFLHIRHRHMPPAVPSSGKPLSRTRIPSLSTGKVQGSSPMYDPFP
ncbi:hypothetical protein MINT15_20730 [Saccharomonospora viridis]|uniref:Uncharacterized protein n=1 Tax=Saccharomonospora viridis TaxID=1852 RepID=A0A837DF78_9PSEU|nr:hypothetical protein MINT15_20730 [Saccharomonospora viridis]